MPPRYAYWTILAGGLPTAFRTATREELLPTFRQIEEKHPGAEMKWFARGRLWESPAEAQAALASSRRAQGEGRGGKGPDDRERSVRGKDWRPGGEHRDPRQGFMDAKKAKNQRDRQKRWERKKAGPQGERPLATSWKRDDRSGGRPGERRLGPAGKPDERGPATRAEGNRKGRPKVKPGAKPTGKPWASAEKHGRKHGRTSGRRPTGAVNRKGPRPPRRTR